MIIRKNNKRVVWISNNNLNTALKTIDAEQIKTKKFVDLNGIDVYWRVSFYANNDRWESICNSLLENGLLEFEWRYSDKK